MSSTSSGTGESTTVAETLSTTEASTEPGVATLEVDEATWDFGQVDFEAGGERTFTITNVGTADASGIASTIDPEFGYPGDAFPGGGTCGAELPAGESCTAIVSILPGMFGEYAGGWVIDYEGPQGADQVSVDLAGMRVGTTANLLVNPGFETQGAPPAGWTEIQYDFAWETVTDTVRTGSAALYGGNVDGNNGDQLIDQNVDLTPYAAPIGDSNGVQVNFVGYARSDGNDDWAFGLRMYDDQDDNVFSQNPNYSQATGWNEEQLGGVAPATARRARVMLWCERDSGTHCSAWYDDLSLTLTYPAP